MGFDSLWALGRMLAVGSATYVLLVLMPRVSGLLTDVLDGMQR